MPCEAVRMPRGWGQLAGESPQPRVHVHVGLGGRLGVARVNAGACAPLPRVFMHAKTCLLGKEWKACDLSLLRNGCLASSERGQPPCEIPNPLLINVLLELMAWGRASRSYKEGIKEQCYLEGKPKNLQQYLHRGSPRR